ncbi:outer membrane beta-barrel protein [Edaphobacter aggregans]|uniref:outer membrane beta-barrel protein n=1 Tax=Edaphobacter aggregans TaxID=570835 RepID=UPI00054D7AC0|nr:outer membrane beta-barrel protein [Edaphobacter aggregans]
MQLQKAVLLTLLLACPWALHGQAVPMHGEGGNISRLEVGANYNFVHANAPPGQCGCFSLNGGSATFLVNITRQWSGVADFAVAHASQVNGTAQEIMIINYFFGGRYTHRNHTRWTPFGEALIGGAKEDVNFRFDINRQSLGFLGGGGVSTRLNSKWGINAFEFDYVHTRIPNSTNNSQNNFRIVTGVTYHFGG